MSERFVRWQGYSMGQLTFALNLFFGLSVGALGFAFTLIRDENFILTSCPKTLFQISLISLSFAILIGCSAVVSRLFDFRYTARKIRSDEKNEGEESAVYKYRSSFLGRLTWRLFWSQLFTLGLGLITLIVSVLYGYSHKIW